MKPIFLFFIFVCAVQLLFSQDYFNRTGKDRALFFAVDDYQSMSDLKNPIKNAREIANALQSLYGFEVEVVPNPSGSAIENKIAAYKQSYQQGLYPSDGQLFIFFTGVIGVLFVWPRSVNWPMITGRLSSGEPA